MSATHLFHLPGYPSAVPAVCPDGKTRNARPSGNGTADTFFSIPAYVNASGTSVVGYITPNDDGSGYEFRPYLYRRNHALVS
jgi:hypothetical protein